MTAYDMRISYWSSDVCSSDLYLRDNMEYRVEDRRQRALAYAIVDEVDSILIDEARTPLIISGQAEDHTELYVRMNDVPPLQIGRAAWRERVGQYVYSAGVSVIFNIELTTVCTIITQNM